MDKKICFEKANSIFFTYSILTYIGYIFICVLKQVKFSQESGKQLFKETNYGRKKPYLSEKRIYNQK